MLLTTVTRGGGSFLILQDVMGWAIGFFIPYLGEGQQKTVSICWPTLYFMTSPLRTGFSFERCPRENHSMLRLSKKFIVILKGQ